MVAKVLKKVSANQKSKVQPTLPAASHRADKPLGFHGCPGPSSDPLPPLRCLHQCPHSVCRVWGGERRGRPSAGFPTLRLELRTSVGGGHPLQSPEACSGSGQGECSLYLATAGHQAFHSLPCLGPPSRPLTQEDLTPQESHTEGQNKGS